MAPVAELDKMMASMSPENAQAGMDAWMSWNTNNQASIVDMGQPLGKNKRVTMQGASDMRNDICGYTIVQAETHDAAAALFERHPHFEIPGAYIEVLECMTIPGM